MRAEAYLLMNVYFAVMLNSSAVAKLANIEGFRFTLARQGIIPTSLQPVALIAIPGAQIAASLFVLSGFLPGLASAAILIMFGTFLIVETSLLRSGKATSCGCFGVVYPITIDSASLVSSGILIGGSTAQLWFGLNADLLLPFRLVALVAFVALYGTLAVRLKLGAMNGPTNTPAQAMS